MSLLHACWFGQPKTAISRLERGADVNEKDSMQGTALHWASLHGFSQLAIALVDNGADIDARDSRSSTPLLWACRKNREDVAMVLIEKGADINAQDPKGLTPLHIACKNSMEQVARNLIQKGSVTDNQMNASVEGQPSPLFYACANELPSIAFGIQHRRPNLDDRGD